MSSNHGRRRARLRVVLALALAGALGADARAGGLSDRDAAAVRGVNDAYVAAWLKNEPQAVTGLFTNDAVLIPQGNRPVEGMEAIKRFWWPAGGGTTTVTSFSITTDEVGGAGDLAYVRGTFKFTFTYEQQGSKQDLANAGNYIMLMKRQSDGSWRITHRMWGDLPRK